MTSEWVGGATGEGFLGQGTQQRGCIALSLLLLLQRPAGRQHTNARMVRECAQFAFVYICVGFTVEFLTEKKYIVCKVIVVDDNFLEGLFFFFFRVDDEILDLLDIRENNEYTKENDFYIACFVILMLTQQTYF